MKGDACDTAPAWFDTNPAAIVAIAIFDMDIYRPTRAALEAVLPRLTRGSLLVFDELTSAHFPGEMQAVRDVLSIDRLRLRLRLRGSPLQPLCAWAVWGA